jgi:hypothetical protein
LLPVGAAAESRTFVVSFFSQATTSVDGDCSKGVNPTIEEQYLLNLSHLGYSKEEIAEMAKKEMEGSGNIGSIMMTRGASMVSRSMRSASDGGRRSGAQSARWPFCLRLDMDVKGRRSRWLHRSETGQRGADHQPIAPGCMQPAAHCKASDLLGLGVGSAARVTTRMAHHHEGEDLRRTVRSPLPSTARLNRCFERRFIAAM